MKTDLDFYVIAVILIFPTYFMYRIIKMKNRRAVHYSFFSFLFSITIWMIGAIILQLYSGKQYENIFLGISYIGIILVPVTFLLTSIPYIRVNFRYRWYHMLLFIIPAISIIMLCTNGSHRLFFIRNSSISTQAVYGPYFYFHMIFSYLCLAIAFGILLIYSIRNSGILSKQSVLILIGSFTPFLVNMALTFKFIDVNMNTTLIAMSITMICYWIAIFKYDFLYIVPLAITRVVDNISDAFFVIDKYYMVIEYNKAFSEIFLKGKHSAKNTYLSDLIKANDEHGIEFEKLKEFMSKSISEKTVINFEMYFCSIDKFFLIEINTIISDGNYMGTVILLKDITEYKKLLKKMKSQNEELTILNEQLTDYAATIKELTLERERSRIETEIHNLMGHNLNVLLRLIEVCKVTFNDDPEKAISSILDAETTIKSTMNNVRRIAQEIGSCNQSGFSQSQNDNSLSYLEILLNNFQKNTGVNVVYSFEGDFSEVNRSLIRVVYSICQEATTNSLKHGKAKMVTVLLRCQHNNVLLSILDDGIGCNDIKELGLGLKGMQEMVRGLNGSIEFKSDENDGFKISVMIPLKESENC